MTGFMKALQMYDKEMGTVNSFPKIAPCDSNPDLFESMKQDEIIEDIEEPIHAKVTKAQETNIIKEVKVTSEPIINADEKEGVNNG